MSVNKFIVNKKQGNFTTIPNKVLQNLHDYEALGLYCYLVSLPHNWEFYKEQLSKHGKCGRDKINKLLGSLEVHELIKVVQIRLENGQFGHFELNVNDGIDFKINDLSQFEPSPLTEKPLTENQLLVNSSYKRNINKTNINKKEIDKISCSSDDELASFEQLWVLYPRKQKRKDALRIWIKNKLYKKSEEIQIHLMKRLQSEWKERDVKYIPLPSTFLNSERWKDEIYMNVTPIKKNTTIHDRNVNYIMEKIKNVD